MMLRNVFAKAIWDRKRSMVWWTVGVVALTAWLVAVFPVIRDSEAMVSFLEDFPPELMAMFGIDPAIYLTGAGYLQAQMFSLMAPIIMIAFTISFGTAATGGEEKKGTMDMLLSAPIGRSSIVLQKAAAMVVLSAVLAVSVAITLIVLNPVFDLGLRIEGISGATASLWLLGAVFGSLAMFIASFSGSPTTAAGVSAFAAVLAWFVNSFSGLFQWLENPSRLSPFSWYLHDLPLVNGFSTGHMWMVLAFLASMTGAVILFSKRDIATERALIPEAAPVKKKQKKAKEVYPRSTWLLRGIFGKTVWDRRITVWFWALGLATMSYITFAAWPSMSQNLDALESMLDAFPKEVLAMFGMSDPQVLSTPEGFASTRTYGSVGPIALIVFSISAMASLVAREESTGKLDMVLSNPVSRQSVVRDKSFGVAVAVGIITTALTVVAFVGSAIWDMGFTPLHVIAANVGLGLLGLCFWGIALSLWSVIGSTGPAIGVTAAVAVASFFFNGIGAIVDVLSPLRWLSPFYWYLGDTVPLAKGFTFGYLALALVAVAGTAVATWRFTTRDLAV